MACKYKYKGKEYSEQEFRAFVKDNLIPKVKQSAITPSIKGHAQFSTDNGIGWFRSDEVNVEPFNYEGRPLLGNYTKYRKGDGIVQITKEEFEKKQQPDKTKTRRILEVQSDLFQKGRGKEVLSKDVKIQEDFIDSNGVIDLSQRDELTGASKVLQNSNSNQFLQLLNKDNNWVTFFIKSIIQDSAKKGYEKVLFPTSEVVSKIQKFDEAAQKYSNAITKPENERTSEDNFIISEWEKESTKKTIKGTLDFYNNLRNTLDDFVGGNKNDRKKGIYKLPQITDEYGNTWSEIEIKPEYLENIKFQTPKLEYTGDLAIEEKIAEMAENSKDEKIAKTRLEKFIQDVINFFRDLVKEKDNISRLIRNLNQGRLFNESKFTKIEDVIDNYLNTPTSDNIISDKKEENREESINKLINKLNDFVNKLGIKIKQVDEIYFEQEQINSLENRLDTENLSEKERTEITNQIEELKSKGVDKKALATADILNRIINITNKDDVSLLTEEVVHFIIDIIEQKNPELYQELVNKSWNYPIRKEIEKEYSGRGDENFITKEVLGQVLTQYLVENETIDEAKDQKTETIWQKIKSFLSNLFNSNNNIDYTAFQSLVSEIFNSDFITEQDVEYLNKRGLYFSLKKENVSPEELVQNLLDVKSKVEIRDVDGQPRYFYEGELIDQRVSDIVKKYYSKLFRDTDRKDGALAELVREEGVDIHKIFELTFLKYVDEKGNVRQTPKNISYGDLENKYKQIIPQIDEAVKSILKQFNNHYILTEVPIITKSGFFKRQKSIGGTLDVMFINKKTGEVSYYDWKTKRGKFFDKNTKKWELRDSLPWWNINGWRIQLGEYNKILRNSYNVKSFGQMRVIPIMTFDKRVENEFIVENAQGKKVIRTEVDYVLDKIEIAPFEKELINPKKKQLLPVVSELEQSPFKTIQDVTSKIRTLINRNVVKMSKDYKNWEDIKDQNQTLETLHTILMVTTNIEEAIKNINVLLYDAALFLDGAPNLNDLSPEEVFKLYQDVKNYNVFLSIYSEIDQITKDFYDKSASKIVEEYEEILNQKDSDERTKYLVDYKTRFDVAKSLISVTQRIKDVRADLYDKQKEYMNAYSNKLGVPGLFEIEPEDNWIEGIINSLHGIYSYNFRTGKLAAKLLLKANAIIQDKNKQSFNKMMNLKNKFLKGKSTKDLEKVFSKILTYNPTINDYFLIPKVDNAFYKEFNEQKQKFQKGYDSAGINFLKTKEYKEIKSWLDENLDVEKYKETIKKSLETKRKSLEEKYKVLKSDDIIAYEEAIINELDKFEYYIDVYKSPTAWDKFNKSLYVNEEKWLSKQYKDLNDIEKEVYSHFRSIYLKGEKLGYVNGYFNLNRVPFKLRATQQIKEKLSPLKAFIYKENDEIYHQFTRIDPVTGNEIHEIPIYMTDYLPAKETDVKKLTKSELQRLEILNQKTELTEKEEKELDVLNAKIRTKRIKDIDLFQVYLEFEYNINRFEELSKVEDMLLELVEIEENKKDVYSIGSLGEISNQKVKKKDLREFFAKRRETQLKGAIYRNLYKITSEQDSFIKINKNTYFSPKKLINFLGDAASLLFIAGQPVITGGAFGASSIIAATGKSKNFDGGKYFRNALRKLANKSHLMNTIHLEAFNHRISQKEVEELDLQRTETIKRFALNGKKYLIDHLSMVDTFIQDTVLLSSLDNFIVVDNKIVNKYDFINSNIDDSLSYDKQRKKERELLSKIKYKTLQQYLDENVVNGKTDISKLDKDSVYKFENIIRLESKKIIGNMSFEDAYNARFGILGALFWKFKAWFPELMNTFFSGVNWREEGGRFEAGRFRSLAVISLAQLDSEEKNNVLKLIKWLRDEIKMVYYTISTLYFEKKSPLILKHLELKYLEYVQTLKSRGFLEIPSKKEYIDLRLQEAKNGANFLIALSSLYFLSIVLSVLSGDDNDDKEGIISSLLNEYDLVPDDGTILKSLFKTINLATNKALKELYTFTSFENLLETITKLTLPHVGVAAEFAKGVKGLLFTTTYALSGGEYGENQIKYVIQTMPYLRPLMKNLVILTKDTEFGEELQEILNVDARYAKKRKKSK